MTNTAEAFKQEVAGLSGAYFDAVHGFVLYHQHMLAYQAATSREFGIPLEELDQRTVTYGSGSPTQPGARVIFAASQGAIKARIRRDGASTHFLGRMLIVSIYQLWEDHYRSRFAAELGFETKDSLGSDLFGEMRHLRRAIVHINGIMISGPGAKLLPWSRGEHVNPSVEQIKRIVFLVEEEIECIAQANSAER